MGAVEDAAEVDRDQPLPLLGRRVGEEAELVGAGVVDEDVERADGLDRRRAPPRGSVTSSSIAWPLISPATRSAPSRLMSPTQTSAPSAASRRRDRGADPAGAAGDQCLPPLQPHQGAQTMRFGHSALARLPPLPEDPIPIIGGTGALGAGLALRWALAGAADRDRLALGRARRGGRGEDPRRGTRRRDRGPPQRGRRAPGGDRLPHRPVPRPVGEPQQPARARSSRARSSSTAPSRSPPRSAARRPARSASGRGRPPSRRRRWSPTASP